MRKLVTRLAVLALFAVVIGCAITDYEGNIIRRTTGEAKLALQEVSFSGFDPLYDGTYSYTVKYDNHTATDVFIYSYRNPVVSSWKRDGIVSVDGDDVQASGGELGGKFSQFFIARDQGAGTCEFGDNLVMEKQPWQVALCYTGLSAMEEYDRDWDVQAAFTDLDQFYKSIWRNETPNQFTLDISAVKINGVNHFVNNAGVQITRNAVRPIHWAIQNGPGMQDVIQAILNNTQSMVPVQFGLVSSGGMAIEFPAALQVGFNHDALRQLVQSSASTKKPIAPKIF